MTDARQWCPDCCKYVEDINAIALPSGDGACSQECVRAADEGADEEPEQAAP